MQSVGSVLFRYRYYYEFHWLSVTSSNSLCFQIHPRKRKRWSALVTLLLTTKANQTDKKLTVSHSYFQYQEYQFGQYVNCKQSSCLLNEGIQKTTKGSKGICNLTMQRDSSICVPPPLYSGGPVCISAVFFLQTLNIYVPVC